MQKANGDNLVFNWLDITAPTEAHLKEIAQEYNLPETMIKDCLDRKHLPKYEKYGELSFIILRAYDDRYQAMTDTVQSVTRKIAVFYRPEFLITVHRSEHKFLSELIEDWTESPAKYTSLKILSKIIYGALDAYQAPIETLNEHYESLEKKIFLESVDADNIRQGYPIKRRIYLFRKIFKLTRDVLDKMPGIYKNNETFLEDLKDFANNLSFQIEDLKDNINNALSLEVGIISQNMNESSFRLNEVMRFLTVFSIFFMPLNLIAGVYGMNFEYMPELKMKAGYPMVLLSMLGITVGIYCWFKHRKWLWGWEKEVVIGAAP